MLAMSPSSDRPILVVDDDAKIVRLVRTYLERERLPRRRGRRRPRRASGDRRGRRRPSSSST